ncbi:MAG: hypothetical protein JW750_08080 [Anaerolineaceae bacterium]|nr:hypothetical protein [Anaerolineaceae bacterium]
MTDQISAETFAHLVELAALELDEQQADYLLKELNAQLTSIAELAAIPIPEDTPASLHGIDYPLATSMKPREDEWVPFAGPQALLDQAPEIRDGHIVVPDIPQTDLE